MDAEIITAAKALNDKDVSWRRDFHKFAEAAWTEFRTASIVAKSLEGLGYQVSAGDDVVDATAMMGVPSATELQKHVERAIAQGADVRWVRKMAGGKTGVVGTMRFAKPGPTMALRVDMDANDLIETEESKHRPFREGFASVNTGVMEIHVVSPDIFPNFALAVMYDPTKEDLERALYTEAEEERRKERVKFKSEEEFFHSLNMVLSIYKSYHHN